MSVHVGVGVCEDFASGCGEGGCVSVCMCVWVKKEDV